MYMSERVVWTELDAVLRLAKDEMHYQAAIKAYRKIEPHIDELLQIKLNADDVYRRYQQTHECNKGEVALTQLSLSARAEIFAIESHLQRALEKLAKATDDQHKQFDATFDHFRVFAIKEAKRYRKEIDCYHAMCLEQQTLLYY